MDDAQWQKLIAECKAYLNTRYDLLRLSLLEKLSRIFGLVLMAMVSILLVFTMLAFVALALVFVLAQWVPMWAACLIMGGVFLLQLILAVVFRKRLFINPVVGALSAILFAQDDQTEKEAQDD